MSGLVFEIDTRATCLLCFANCGKEDNVAAGTPTFIQRQISYKMLLRYLKINVLKLAPFSSSFGTFLDGSEGANASLEVLLCSDCSAVTTEFLELFQIFDEARLRLDEICGLMLNRIKEGEEDEKRLEEYRNSLKNATQLSGKPAEALLNASLAESLRNETKQKCSERLSKSIPKVTLSRGDSSKRRKIDSFTISKEVEITSEKIIEPSILQSLLAKEPNLERPPDKSQSSQEVEDCIDSMETEVGTETITFHRSEVQDEPEHGSPIQDQLIPPPPPSPTIDLTLSPASKPPELSLSSLLASSSSNRQTYKEMDYLREHLILVNLLIKYAPRIPPNTTVVQVQSAINSIAFGQKGLTGGMPILSRVDGKFSCTICPQKFLWANRLRTHIFLHHFNQVLDLLLGKVDLEMDLISKTILDNIAGNQGTTSQDNQDNDPLGNEEDLMLQDIPQLDFAKDEDDDPLILEDPLMDKPIPPPPSSSSQQTNNNKKPCPALTPIPPTVPRVPPGILVPVTLSPKPTFPCSKCDKLFVSEEYLLKHRAEVHMDNSVPPRFFMCSKCRKMFRSRAQLGTHIKCEHTFDFFKDQIPPSTSEAELEQVVNSFVTAKKAVSSSGGGGGTMEDVVGCRICCSLYVLLPQKNLLRTHILDKHFEMVASAIVQQKSADNKKGEGGEEGEKCLCHICSRDFISDHSTMNANETIFECNYCGKLFPGRGNLRFHLVISHPIIVFSGELPPGTSESEFNKVVDKLEEKITAGLGLQAKFECSFCPRRYAKRMFIRPHILHKHFDQVLKHLKGGGAGGGGGANEQKPELIKPSTPEEVIEISIPGLSATPPSTSTTGPSPVLGHTFQGTLGTNNGMLSFFVIAPPKPGNM